MHTPIESLSSLLPANLESIVMLIQIVVAGLFLGSMANRTVKLVLNRTNLEGLAASFIARAARIGVYVIALVSALRTLGVDTIILIGALGSAGLAIGLALRDTLSNLSAGLILAFNSALNFFVGISYDDDIERAETFTRQVMAQQISCLTDPEVVVGADNLGDFGQNILVRVWVDNDFVITGKMQLLREIKRAFDREK